MLLVLGLAAVAFAVAAASYMAYLGLFGRETGVGKKDSLDQLLDDWKKDIDEGLNDGWERRK